MFICKLFETPSSPTVETCVQFTAIAYPCTGHLVHTAHSYVIAVKIFFALKYRRFSINIYEMETILKSTEYPIQKYVLFLESNYIQISNFWWGRHAMSMLYIQTVQYSIASYTHSISPKWLSPSWNITFLDFKSHDHSLSYNSFKSREGPE